MASFKLLIFRIGTILMVAQIPPPLYEEFLSSDGVVDPSVIPEPGQLLSAKYLYFDDREAARKSTEP